MELWKGGGKGVWAIEGRMKRRKEEKKKDRKEEKATERERMGEDGKVLWELQ